MGCSQSAPAAADSKDPDVSFQKHGGKGGQGSAGEGEEARGSILEERKSILGAKQFLARADQLATNVLPLANAFDTFDVDNSAGLSAGELRSALEHLGVQTTEEVADRILKQYDQYPDEVIDIKEFATIVKDIKLMLAFDTNGDGVLDEEELLPCLTSLGVKVDASQVHDMMNRFDVDGNGTIDLVELSSLVRTAQAFTRYDTDQSGAIDPDELRDALRKLGLKAGNLETEAVFKRYDIDCNGTLELHEFAVLVRDLQLYAGFDTDCDGSIDADELTEALKALGLPDHPAASSADEALKVLTPWDTDADGRLEISEFTRWAADVRVFKDADKDKDNHLSRTEFAAAMKVMEVQEDVDAAFEKFKDGEKMSLQAFGRATHALITETESTQATYRTAGAVSVYAETSVKRKMYDDQDRI